MREIAPPEISGRLSSINKICFSIGLVIVFGMGLGLPETPEVGNTYWIYVTLMPCFISLLRLPFFLCIYKFDTPKYYVLHG